MSKSVKERLMLRFVRKPRILERLQRVLEKVCLSPPPKAVSVVNEGRVYLIHEKLDVWLVEGEHGDYIVLRRLSCSCPWFTSRFLTGETDKVCYHLVAVELAAKSGRYRKLDLSPDDVVRVITEALFAQRSATLRRLLAGNGAESMA